MPVTAVAHYIVNNNYVMDQLTFKVKFHVSFLKFILKKT